MFVRWKRRQRTRTTSYGHWGTGEWVKSAVLVRSVRTDQGPRQRIVAYLGSIGEGKERYHWHQVGFWEAVDPRLDAAQLDAADRSRIELSLASVVSRPTEDSRVAAVAELGEITKRLHRLA
jgi:hypothetical protein